MVLRTVGNHVEASMRPNTRAFRIELILIILACSLPIVVHVINSMNSRMLADDFCFAANVFGKD